MNRRTLLRAAAALLAGWPLAPALAHTPYRQWDIFRRRYLQVLTSRSDLAGDAAGDEWVALLLSRLPLSRAMVSRARDMTRVASLMKTDQARLAVLSHDDARQLAGGLPPYEDFAPMPLQVLLANRTHVLAARDNLPLHHGSYASIPPGGASQAARRKPRRRSVQRSIRQAHARMPETVYCANARFKNLIYTLFLLFIRRRAAPARR